MEPKSPHTHPKKKKRSASKCQDTYGDLLPLVGLQDPDACPFLVPQGFQTELRPGFLQLAVAHVKDGDIVALPHGDATVAGNGVMSAATVPQAGVDLECPDEAPVKDKGSGLVVFITSARCRSSRVSIVDLVKPESASDVFAKRSRRTCRPG